MQIKCNLNSKQCITVNFTYFNAKNQTADAHSTNSDKAHTENRLTVKLFTDQTYTKKVHNV